MDKAIISYMRIGYFRIGVIKLVFDEIKDQFEKCARIILSEGDLNGNEETRADFRADLWLISLVEKLLRLQFQRRVEGRAELLLPGLV